MSKDVRYGTKVPFMTGRGAAMADRGVGAMRRTGDVFALYAEIYALRLTADVPSAVQDCGLGSRACDTELSAAAAVPSPPSH
jgi:hypothetical protein